MRVASLLLWLLLGTPGSVDAPLYDALAAQVYRPYGEVPSDLRRMRLERAEGRWWVQPDPERPSPSRRRRAVEGFVAGWASPAFGGPHDPTEVLVTLEPAPEASTDDAWLRALFRRATGSVTRRSLREREARVLMTDRGRQADWGIRSACCGGDLITRWTRYLDRGDGTVLRVEVVVYGWPSEERARELRRAFLDGPLSPELLGRSSRASGRGLRSPSP